MNDDGWVDGRDDEEVKKKEMFRDYVCYRTPYYHMYAFMPERSKGVHSSCIVFVLVGSNPTECIHFLFYFYIIIIPPTSLSLLTRRNIRMYQHDLLGTNNCVVNR